MRKFSPPSTPEWHSSVVGFGTGFAFGADDCDSDVAKWFVRGVMEHEHEEGHVGQTHTEAAYATVCFVLGAVVGRRWSREKG